MSRANYLQLRPPSRLAAGDPGPPFQGGPPSRVTKLLAQFADTSGSFPLLLLIRFLFLGTFRLPMTIRNLLAFLSLLVFFLMTLSPGMAKPIRVVVWDEQQPAQKSVYPNFLGNHIAEHLKSVKGLEVRSVRMDDPQQGLSDEVLNQCDVLVWWGHVRHAEVNKERVEKIVQKIKEGKLVLLALHSAHWSQPFIRAMEERTKADALNQLSPKDRRTAEFQYITLPKGLSKPTDPPSPSIDIVDEGGKKKVKVVLPSCVFPSVRADGAPSRVTILKPKHPLAKGVPETFVIPQTEMYSDPFTVPKPDFVLLEERWDKGESFRSGSYWSIGKGYVYYFRPGHETYPVFKQPETLKIVENAVKYLGPKVQKK